MKYKIKSYLVQVLLMALFTCLFILFGRILDVKAMLSIAIALAITDLLTKDVF